MSRDDNEKELLQRTLNDRAHAVDGAGVGFDEVLRSARGIRRRRRIVTGAAGLAVVAVVVPFGISLAGSNDAAPLPAATNSPSPSVHQSQVVTANPSPTNSPSPPGPGTTHRLDPATAAQGAPPRISYAEGATIHSYGGQAVTMPNAFTGFMEWRGDWLLRGQQPTSVPDANSLQTVDANGHVLKTQPTWGELWKSSDGVERAWSVAGQPGKSGSILSGPDNTMGEGGPARIATPPGAAASVVGMTAGDLIYSVAPGSSGTQVWADNLAGHSTRLPISGKTPVDATYAHGGLIALNDQNQSCTSVVRGLAAKQLWVSCDYSAVSFSPSGTYLLAEPSSAGGALVNEFDLLDAETGALVGTYRLDGSAALTDIAWEGDDSHLLISVYDHGQWTMDRVSVKGSIERVLGPSYTHQSDGPWLFEAVTNR